jgi:hypothetical protein
MKKTKIALSFSTRVKDRWLVVVMFRSCDIRMGARGRLPLKGKHMVKEKKNDLNSSDISPIERIIQWGFRFLETDAKSAPHDPF